ncbi:MAG: GDSL-type esterase/lipase family protein [Planctomycetota bacterium]
MWQMFADMTHSFLVRGILLITAVTLSPGSWVAAATPTHARVAYGSGNDVMDLYLPESPVPSPVFVFGHAKGQTLDAVPQEAIKRLRFARMAFISVEANDVEGDGRQEIGEAETWARVIAFLSTNAKRFNLDMNNVFVGGRSLGSIGAFPYAMDHADTVRGVYCVQAIPDQGETFAPLVAENAPPCRFIFRSTIGSHDHDPINGVKIGEAYRRLGIADRFAMKSGVEVGRWYDDLHEFMARNRVGSIVDYDPFRFAGAMGAFEKEDRRNGIPEGGTVFVGSSSIARLDRETVFPNHPMTLRGLRGGHISDLNHFVQRLVLRYKPSRVIFFCGGNDLWVGHTPQEVLADFREFSNRLFAEHPSCELIHLAIRPSVKKRAIVSTVLQANELLEKNADGDSRITFLRGSCDEFLDEHGDPIPTLYAPDRNHMNADGYKIWSRIVTPLLDDD